MLDCINENDGFNSVVTNDDALAVYHAIESSTDGDVVTYRQGWDKCMECTKGWNIFDDIMGSAPLVIRNGLQTIRQNCLNKYLSLQRSCPMDCVRSVMSSVPNLVNYTKTYDDNMKKPFYRAEVASCFDSNNKCYHDGHVDVTLPGWTVVTNPSVIHYNCVGAKFNDADIADLKTAAPTYVSDLSICKHNKLK